MVIKGYEVIPFWENKNCEACKMVVFVKGEVCCAQTNQTLRGEKNEVSNESCGWISSLLVPFIQQPEIHDVVKACF